MNYNSAHMQSQNMGNTWRVEQESGSSASSGMAPQNRMVSPQNETMTHPMDNPRGVIDVRSFQELLFASIGKFVVCRFLIGTDSLMTASGILRNVGRDFFVLEDPCTNMMTSCDLYAVKFVSVLPDEFMENIPSYCRRRLYENAPIFTAM